MDPVANIKEQRETAEAIMRELDNPIGGDMTDAAERLAELVIALDDWRKRGGFDPYTNV